MCDRKLIASRLFKVFSLNVVSTRAGTPKTGTIQIKLGSARTANAQNLWV
jgi:hypothetical protein